MRMHAARLKIARIFLASTLLFVNGFLAGLAIAQTSPQKPTPKPPAKPAPTPPAATDAIPSPVSRHYPILILSHGNEPPWAMRLGMKGPERLDRPGYPPIILDPAEVTTDEAGTSWTYRAKDDATNADIAVKLSREACSDGTSEAKSTFKVVVQHAQIGTLSGCGQSAPDKFPEFRKKNQLDMPDDADDKDKTKDKDKGKDKDKDKDKDRKSVLDPIINFHPPVAVAYLDGAGRVIFAHGEARKTVAAAGSELAVSHDGKKLLYTRADSKTGPERSIVLYELETGRSRDLAGSNVRSAFWSPDDSRVAFLKYDGKEWQVWTLPVAEPEKAAQWSTQTVDSLHGWMSTHTVLATDMQNAYWLSEDRPPESTPLQDIYGDALQAMSSDTLRPNPINSDLLLVSAYYKNIPPGAPVDSVGLNSTFFLYEVKSKRRTILGPAEAFTRAAEWSRDGLQIFFTRGVPGKNTLATSRIFWDSTGLRAYYPGSYFVVGK
jgi:uncharacterized membrane protein